MVSSQLTPSRAERLFTPVFLLGFLYNFVISLHFTNNALYPLYVLKEGGGVGLVGVFMGVYAVSGVLARPAVGVLLDRHGPRSVLILGSLALSLPALGYLAMLGHGLPAPVWVLRALQGAGYGAHFSATFTLAATIAPEGRRNEAVALYGTSGLAGAMVGPVLGEALVEGPGLAWFFGLMASVGIIAAAVISRVPIPSERPKQFPHARDVFSAFRIPELRVVLLLAFLFGITYTSPTAFLATIARERGIGHFGLYFTAWGISGILVRFIGGSWGDRLGLRRVLLPGYALYATGMLVVHLSSSIVPLIAAGTICGAAHGITFPAVTSLGYSLAPKGATGSSMAVITGMMDTGAAMTALVMGPLAESMGYGVVFPVAAAASFAASFVLYMSIRRDPRRIAPVRPGETEQG